jgi:glycosyl transferase family 87
MLSPYGNRVDMNNDRNHASAGRGLVEPGGGASAAPSVDCGGVLSANPTRTGTISSWIKTFLVLAFVSVLAGLVGVRLSDSLRGTDFPDFYCAARMLAEGHGHQLYDADVQREFQARYSGRVGTLYIHPPFEAVLYLGVAWLPEKRAYLLWSFFSLVFLAVALWRLAKDGLLPWDWRLWFAASLTFAPGLLCLRQGQDSLLLLLLVVLAFRALRGDRALAAGCWLGLGLFKFQLVLPLVLVLILTGRGSRGALAKGFGLVALALAALSAALSGWSVFTAYPNFLMHLQAERFSGVIPSAMANFRGLAWFFFRTDRSVWAIAAVIVLSATALAPTLAMWKHSPAAKTAFDLAFANTVLFALLVSYHLNPHDLSLLLLPATLLLNSTFSRRPRLMGPASWIAIGLIGILFLPPLQLWALQAGVYCLVSVPLLALFLSGASLARRDKTDPVS